MDWRPVQTPTFRMPSSGNAGLDAAGYINGKPGWLDRRDMDCHAIVYVLAGGGHYADSRNGERPVAAGDVLVLFPGLVHSYGPRDAGRTWDEGFLVFHGDCFAALEKDGLLDRRRPVWSPGLAPALIDAFDALVADFRAGGADPRLTVARIHHLLADLAVRDGSGGKTKDPLAAAKARLAERLDAPVDLERIAADAGMGYEAFRKRFTASEGMPPARWRQQRRIDRAKALLAESEAGLADIAGRLGYCDQFFFSRQFKRVAGVTPGAFRASVRGR